MISSLNGSIRWGLAMVFILQALAVDAQGWLRSRSRGTGQRRARTSAWCCPAAAHLARRMLACSHPWASPTMAFDVPAREPPRCT